jgi:hypothetical protein
MPVYSKTVNKNSCKGKEKKYRQYNMYPEPVHITPIEGYLK